MKARYFAFHERADNNCQELDGDNIVIFLHEQNQGAILFVDDDSQKKIKIEFNTENGEVNAIDLDSKPGVTIIYHFGQFTTDITKAMKRRAIFDLLLGLASLGDKKVQDIFESRHRDGERYSHLDEVSLDDTLNLILREAKAAYQSTVKPRTPFQAFSQVWNQSKQNMMQQNPIQQAIYEVLMQAKYSRECITSQEIVKKIIADIQAKMPEQPTLFAGAKP